MRVAQAPLKIASSLAAAVVLVLAVGAFAVMAQSHAVEQTQDTVPTAPPRTERKPSIRSTNAPPVASPEQVAQPAAPQEEETAPGMTSEQSGSQDAAASAALQADSRKEAQRAELRRSADEAALLEAQAQAARSAFEQSEREIATLRQAADRALNWRDEALRRVADADRTLNRMAANGMLLSSDAERVQAGRLEAEATAATEQAAYDAAMAELARRGR